MTDHPTEDQLKAKIESILARHSSRKVSVNYDKYNRILNITFIEGFYGIVFEEMLWLSKLLGTTKINIETESGIDRISEVSADLWTRTTLTCSGINWGENG